MRDKKQEKVEKKKKDYHMIELNYSSFYRSIQLSYPVKSNKAEADHDKGTLEIILPKSETAQTKQIEVNVKKRSVHF